MLFKEPSLSPEESLQAERQTSFPLMSDEKTDSGKEHKAVTKQDGSVGLTLESQSLASSQSSTGPVSSLENAVTSSLELRGSPKSDSIHISKDKQDCSAHHEDDSRVIDGEFACSAASNAGEAASLLPEEYHSTLTGDASKGTESELFCQYEGSSPPVFVDAQTNNNFFVNEISKIEEKLPLKLNGHHLQSHVQTPIKMKASETDVSNEHFKKVSVHRGFVDTTAPIESVKEAVSKFGGILDWKAHKALTIEKRNQIHCELEKIRGGIRTYRKDSEAAEVAEAEALKELDNIKRLIEVLKLNIERAQTEEAITKQDSQFAQLLAKDIEDGSANEASVASKTQLEVAKARSGAAVAELKTVKEEIMALQEQCASLVGQVDITMRRSEEALSASKEIEKEVENLTLELITAKESLESAYAAHLEAEEHRMSAALERDVDFLNWDKEMKQAQQELYGLNEQLLQAKDLKVKLIVASSLLADLKKELAAYIESQLNEQSQSFAEEDKAKDSLDESKGFQLALASKKKELEDLKANIEMAKDEVTILRVAESSLKSELEKEKAELASSRQREGMALIAVSSVEAEIGKTIKEIKLVVEKEKEAREKMVELPKLLQEAALEADKSKSSAKMAREEQRKFMDEVEQVKYTLRTAKTRLTATSKEIEAAGASERLAFAAVKALQDSEEAAALGDSSRGVNLPLEEYYTMSKKAHEAEELSNQRITSATAQIQVAKLSELSSLQKLKEAYQMMDRMKEELSFATEKANKAKEGKLGIEQELREWRAEHEQRRRASDGGQIASNTPRSPTKIFDDGCETKTENIAGDKTEHTVPEFKPRKKSFFPHMVRFLARKRAQSRK
ncbi:protein WEAK CHLOROPLAST MOVEMENT UNDER BLUE LIGHT 1 [Dendrobium catenatum]|uniref:Protein WEAK CHLOROPLAST MOVEMENT UNDER BLUE LIGHT 1 n=1 Tax=Dendrobium catenatum TaxID=906689 RepID=A0A2I0W0E7_9ASPA|nr:protein WEAK CHLOROPLAST MOVEMENT UNDER BLUE LIGHT 1 [Dendrobium catenatum]PKU69130.1 Protein WEAK CHLOROPLAST MOVEMENT UNDER BLUE LIGHT 1 [Dendrobium catenatum]